jgi:hypothetical protein
LNWEDEQEKLLVGPKLLALGADVVFDELKKLSAKTKTDRWWNNSEGKYEISLLHRNERLINLGLAAYGTNQEVLTALYRHGLEPVQDEADANYKEGLRIGCLSNNTAPEAHMLDCYPEEIIGKEETGRVLNAGTRSETTALIQNPQVSDRLLEALYTRSAAFAEMPEERWRELIWMSASNKRLVTEYEYVDMPDTGHYGIHKRIFALLEAHSTIIGFAQFITCSTSWIFSKYIHQNVLIVCSNIGAKFRCRKERMVKKALDPKAITPHSPFETNSGAS